MIDYLIIKELQNHANVIPVIGRSENLSQEQFLKIKSEINEYQKNYQLEIFNINETVKVYL